MLTEQGLVVSAQGRQAVVRTHRSEACAGCGAQGACKVLGGGKEVEVEALNYIRAKTGDRVEVSVPESVFLKASVITYLLPLSSLLAGAVVGQIAAPSLGWSANGASIVLAGLGLGLSGLIVVFLNRRLAGREEYVPRITKILPPLSEVSGGSHEGTC